MTFLSRLSSRPSRVPSPSALRRFAPALAALSAAAGALTFTAAAAAQPMVYYGGRVISNVEIVQVGWTSGVDPTFLQDLATFHQALVQTPYLDWLTEYDTTGKVGLVDGMPGSNQHIGRGSYGGSFTITPANGSTSLQDSDIAAEVVAQIGSGALPPPKLDAGGNVNTFYVIEFPAAYSINLYGIVSCSQFGGYHSTALKDGKSVPYAVIPDCGYDFQTATYVDTHELVEAITDTEAGLVPDFNLPTDRPIAWAGQADNFWNAPECSDVCQNITDTVAGYTVATNWSNFANGCVAQIPLCDGTTQPPACRPCNTFDSGVACTGATPACATSGPSVGQCVLCTAAAPGACTGATPACDEATYTCVECLQNSDCQSAGAPVCETSTKTCRACAADAECASGHCDLQEDAQKGQCVDCNADTDCDTAKHCDTHACVDTQTDPGDGGSSGSGAGGGGSGGASSSGGSKAGCSCHTEGGGDTPDARFLALGLLAAAGVRRARRSGRRAASPSEHGGHRS